MSGNYCKKLPKISIKTDFVFVCSGLMSLAGCFVVDRKVWEKNWCRRTKYKTQDEVDTQQH